MTQEEKFLLLQDLCSRLPYGVKVQDELGRVNKLVIGNADLIRLFYNDFSIYGENAISLPLLRPMSSMTEEEVTELAYKVLQQPDIDIVRRWVFEGKLHPSIDGNPVMVIDWLNKKMFAYRTIDGKDMFELGLALEAPEGIYE